MFELCNVRFNYDQNNLKASKSSKFQYTQCLIKKVKLLNSFLEFSIDNFWRLLHVFILKSCITFCISNESKYLFAS